MVEKIIKYIITFVGFCIGIVFGIYFIQMLNANGIINLESALYYVLSPALFGIIFAIITYFISKLMIKLGKALAQYTQVELEKIPPQELIFQSAGLVLGLLVAFLVSELYEIIPIPVVANALKIVTFIFLGYLGIILAQKNFKDSVKIQDWMKRLVTPSAPKTAAKTKTEADAEGEYQGGRPKILDTSVIIDGRISDICKTGFVEGPIVIPEFVLKELRHIADSSDDLKRTRGRRGLDRLKVLQQEVPIEVKITDEDFEEVSEVDVKLIKLAQKYKGCLVTTDYNLNKVATLQDIPILNINELANAIKPVVLPGEEMTVQVIKEGKEHSQGVGYLDDGTMIVVEDGRHQINKTIRVEVTSVLQTAAGRMIFAKQVK